MDIIPAIDLREGYCARILNANKGTEFLRSDDPVEQAAIFRNYGAQWVNVTDLDASFSGHLCNLDVIKDLVDMSGLRVQHYGGVRKMKDVDRLIDLGVERVVLSAAFLRDSEKVLQAVDKYGEKVIPGVDGKNGMVASEGFETAVDTSVMKMLNDLKAMGLKQFLYTDRRRVGASNGPNFEGIGEVLSVGGMNAMIAGGINSYEAIERLASMGASSLIIGKAILDGSIELSTALKMC